jgi:hypothetical protein
MGDGKERSVFQKAQDRLSAITSSITGTSYYQFPAFDQLPKVQGQPQGCLWGFFDKDGHHDEIGTLNLLTSDDPDRRARSARLVPGERTVPWLR